MSFSNSVRNIQSIGGYDQAARFFAETRKPKTARWSEDERPLYNTRSLHYRIVRGHDASYFDLVNYDTPLIRYYKPDTNGDQRILVRDWDSQVSRQFLYKHRWFQGKPLIVRNLDGSEREGRLLLNRLVSSAQEHGVERGWSADFVLIADTAERPIIDASRSHHIPGYKAVSSAEDKAKRKALKEAAAHWVELMAYRIPEFDTNEIAANAWNLRSAGEAFTSAVELLEYSEQKVIRVAFEEVIKDGDSSLLGSEAFTEAFVGLGHAVWTHLKRRVENACYQGYAWDHRTNNHVKLPDLPYVAPTREQFKKSMLTHLMGMTRVNISHGRVPVEQFPTRMPSRWFL